jgi:glycosyltransferase involved in cell wall biosynthesis
MKIRFVIPGLWHGGGPRNVYALAMHLAKSGHDASVVAFADLTRIPRFLGGSKSRPSMSGAPVRFLREPLGLVNQAVWKASMKTQWFIPVQLITSTLSMMTTAEPAFYVATAWQTAFPVLRISEIEGNPCLYFAQAYETTFKGDVIHKYFSNRTYMYPFIRFTQSAWLKRFLDQNYGGRTYHVGMGIDHDVFRPAKVIHNKPRIVTIARKDPNKGFDVFVEAIRRLCKIRNDFEVVIIGEKAAVDSHKIDFPFRFAGWITKDQELASLYQGSIFVSSGKHEALPMPPLEAMACAATVVITDTDGAREYTSDDQNCLLVPIGDAKAMADRINEALSNESLREELSKNAIHTASRYRWDFVVEKFEEMAKKEGVQ